MRMSPRGPFVVIGENIHATRSLQRTGRHVGTAPDGREAIVFADAEGATRHLAVPPGVRDGQEFAAGKVKHVKSAVIAGMSAEGADAADGRDYLLALARRQVEAGADYLDLNVDEVTADPDGQEAAMAWLVGLVEGAVPVPVSLDSSNAAVIRAGLEVATSTRGKPLLNSASLDRRDVLALAAEYGCPVVVSAAGLSAMPADADARVENATRIVEAALELGISLADLHVDPLVLPVATDPAVGRHYLDAVRRVRDRFGPEIHLTGGLSNVSFGLPARRVLNDAFIDLAVEAGADSGIIDPVANDLDRIFSQDRSARSYRLAREVLTGDDPYGGAYLAAYRKGELDGAG